MTSPEAPIPSVEEVFLRQEIADKIQEYQNNLVVEHGGKRSNVLLKIMLYGKISSSQPGIDSDVIIATTIYGNLEETTTLTVGDKIYSLLPSGIIYRDRPEQYLGDAGLMSVRHQLRDTRWPGDETNPSTSDSQDEV
ncbi:MAG TPA: hypothetical protein VMR76_02215 [Candidatus Saccharimonadia bacterium]|nr:hypothetical protein [Candidatus Saccharimonadia bacterium]